MAKDFSKQNYRAMADRMSDEKFRELKPIVCDTAFWNEAKRVRKAEVLLEDWQTSDRQIRARLAKENAELKEQHLRYKGLLEQAKTLVSEYSEENAQLKAKNSADHKRLWIKLMDCRKQQSGPYQEAILKLEKENAELKFKLGPTNCPYCGSHLVLGETHECGRSGFHWKGGKEVTPLADQTECPSCKKPMYYGWIHACDGKPLEELKQELKDRGIDFDSAHKRLQEMLSQLEVTPKDSKFLGLTEKQWGLD